MHKLILTSILLFSSFTAHASLILQSGESFSSSFNLVSDGQAFKPTDFSWDASILTSFTGSASVSFTAFENADFTQSFFTSEIFGITSGVRSNLGSFDSAFSDLNGAFTITNNGVNDVDLTDVIISNFAGTALPSNIATVTITPSAVPVPAAIWLFGSGLIGLAGIARRKKA